MKKVRESFDSQLEEIHKELLQAGVGGPVRPGALPRSEQRENDLRNAEEPTTAASIQLTASAFQLAGYAVATLVLGRSIPAAIVLQVDAEYDIGRCSETDLDTVWAVGNLAAERSRGDGAPWEPGPSIIIFKMESDTADAVHDKREMGEGVPDGILNENWDDIVHVARLLIDRRTLSRAEIEAEIFEPADVEEGSC
jgi:hypothetical protein